MVISGHSQVSIRAGLLVCREIKAAEMKNTRMIILSVMMSLYCGLYAAVAAAEEAYGANHKQMKSMSPAEYEQYRLQLDQEVKDATSGAQKQGAVTGDGTKKSEPDQKEIKPADSGYGKGYRARMQHDGSTAGGAAGFRGDPMNRGGGRNR